MPNPYAAINAMRAGRADAPSISYVKRAPVTPSPRAQAERDAELHASIVASIAFRSTCERRGDYRDLTAAHLIQPGGFSTKR